MLGKTKKFIYNLGHNLSYKKNQLSTLHERMKQVDFDKVKLETHIRNPYQVFLDWLLFEVLLYGILLAFVFVAIFKPEHWYAYALLPLVFGIARWLWFDFVKRTSESIRGE